MITLLLATAALSNPWDIDIEDNFLNIETGAFLGQPDVYIDDDWFMMDIAAAPDGRVVLTLEQSCDPALCSAGSQRLSARVDGQIVQTIEFKVTETSAIAIDHLDGDGDEKASADVFVMLAENNLIFPILWVSELNLLHAGDFTVGPQGIAQPLDIAAGNGNIYVTGLTADNYLLLSRKDEAGWITTDTPIDWQVKPGEYFPSIVLDRTRNRLTMGYSQGLHHYTSDLNLVGECLTLNDLQDPHLGREFAVEDGVLIYINRTSNAFDGATFEHRMHIADSDECTSLDVLDSAQTYTMDIHTESLTAMSIEPQPLSEWWPISQNPEPHVRSWTTIEIGKGVPVDEHWVGTGTGIFSVEGFMERRPF